MDLGLCISVYGNIAKLNRFISSETIKLVEKLADIDLEAAKKIFQDLEISKNPSREIGFAIGILQSAHAKYIDVTKSLKVKLSYQLLGSTKLFDSYRKASDTSILIGICYHLLDDPLEIKYLKEGLQEFEKSVQLELDLLQKLVRDPHWPGDQRIVEIRQEELEKIRVDLVKLVELAEMKVNASLIN